MSKINVIIKFSNGADCIIRDKKTISEALGNANDIVKGRQHTVKFAEIKINNVKKPLKLFNGVFDIDYSNNAVSRYFMDFDTAVNENGDI